MPDVPVHHDRPAHAEPGEDWTKVFRAAADSFDWDQVQAITARYRSYLRAAEPVPVPEAKAVLLLLRENRRYEDLLAVADALLAAEVTDQAVVRSVAQVLVDRGRPAAGLLVFESLLAEPAAGPARVSSEDDRVEAGGGIGRCTKEMFLTAVTPPARAGYLRRSYAAYRAAYDRNPANHWHGINAVALLLRAERERIDLQLPGPVVRPDEAERLARELLGAINGRAELDVWARATACEAGIALGDPDQAFDWARQLVNHRPSAFALGALLRQLVSVWQLDTGQPPGDRLLPLLRAALLAQHGGDVVLETADLHRDRFDPATASSFEKVFGTTGFVALPWYRTGLERCRAVARVEDRFGRGIGTGVLIDGRDLSPGLPELVLMTNAHVVPEGLGPDRAVVVFHGLDADPGGPHRTRVRKAVWSVGSAAADLDTTLLELESYPADVVPAPVSFALPGLDQPQRAYLIGHPDGLPDPHFSLQDNAILDHDGTRVHYRSPTRPGSSGSPVFDQDWDLIGLHHSGGSAMLRLKGAGGTYAANEAIALQAIRERLETEPPAPG